MTNSPVLAGRSLRRTLTWLLLGALLLLGLISGAVSYYDALTEANELFDAKLAHSARLVEAIADRELMNPDLPKPLVVDVSSAASVLSAESDYALSDGHAYETLLAFQAWSAEGVLLLRSSNAPWIPLAQLQAGFEDVQLEGRRWRSFTLRDPHGEWYQSGEDYAIRQELAREIAIGTLLPWLLVLPAMAVAVWLIVGVTFRSLQRVADQVRNRDSHQLGPIEVAQVPQEIQGLVAAVNGLLGRLDRALDGERSFTADAAHELRTPLAALRLHAENLAAARDEQERQRSLADLRVSVERSQRLIDQLLALARLDPLVVSDRDLPALDLAALLAKVMAELSGQADARRTSLQLDRGSGLPRLPGAEIALGVLFRNLVDNALRYSPPGSQVRVAVDRASLDDGRAALRVRVDDDGPGIPEHERELAFERFHRGLRQSASGTGLGLAIARRIVELHQGSIRLQDAASQGLRVEVLLPLKRVPTSGEVRTPRDQPGVPGV